MITSAAPMSSETNPQPLAPTVSRSPSNACSMAGVRMAGPETMSPTCLPAIHARWPNTKLRSMYRFQVADRNRSRMRPA